MTSTPVLALHGQPGARWVYAPVAGRLHEDGVTVLVPDRPGYGASCESPTGVAGNATWLLAQIAATPQGRAVVVAHSWAALPALVAAHQAPEAVAALVLLSPAGPSAVTSADRLIARPGLGELITWPLAVPAAGRLAWIADPWLRFATPRADLAAARTALRQTPARGVMRSFLVEQKAMIDELQLVTDAVPQIQVPVSVVVGTSDALIAPRTMLELARSLPTCELVLLHGSGHSVQLHRPAEVTQVIRTAVERAG